MTKTLREMTAEIRALNIEKGWRDPDGGPGTSTFGDYVALLHSEVSEALEAYRDHRLEDVTEPYDLIDPDTGGDIPAKPEGVGSELADVLIRLLDMCDVFGIVPFDMDCELADVEPAPVPLDAQSFGDSIVWLHDSITHLHRMAGSIDPPARVLRTLVLVAERYGIDLIAEVDRKIAYNRTRSFRHGGRHL